MMCHCITACPVTSSSEAGGRGHSEVSFTSSEAGGRGHSEVSFTASEAGGRGHSEVSFIAFQYSLNEVSSMIMKSTFYILCSRHFVLHPSPSSFPRPHPPHTLHHPSSTPPPPVLRPPASQSSRMRLVVTDGVFSMDGDVAPLEGICELAERYGALVFIDECHATGFLGPRGR